MHKVFLVVSVALMFLSVVILIINRDIARAGAALLGAFGSALVAVVHFDDKSALLFRYFDRDD